MPRQHDHHRAEFDLAGAAGHIGEKLENIWHHSVGGEVVLNTPNRVEPQRLSQVGKFEIVLIHVIVRPLIVRVLHKNRHADFHNGPPYG
jgi:hypothetical protein